MNMLALHKTDDSSFLCNDSLYHYTTYESLFKILKDMTLKSSQLSKLNDLNEANINNFYMDNEILLKLSLKDYMTEKCNLICFTKDYEYEGFVQKGTNRPSMWAHYANNATGACIVIDRQRFIENNKELLDAVFYKFEDVVYKFNTSVSEADIFMAKSPSEFIKKNYYNIFYLKHLDWATEAEHRLFYIGDIHKLSILNCVKYIELGSRFVEKENLISELVSIISNPQYKCYKSFTPHSFTQSRCNTHGYLGIDASYKIKECMDKNRENILPYLEWYKSNFT